MSSSPPSGTPVAQPATSHPTPAPVVVETTKASTSPVVAAAVTPAVVSMAVPMPSPSTVPSSVPSTTIAIVAPAEPEHITIAPAVVPVLAVPAVTADTTARIITSMPAARQVERIDTIVDLPARSSSRSRRGSESDIVQTTTVTDLRASDRLPIPARIDLPPRPGSGDLRSGLASPIIPTGAVEVLIAQVHSKQDITVKTQDPLSTVTMFAGKDRKPFYIHRHLLNTQVPYFQYMMSHGNDLTQARMTFEDLDEFGFALFVRWIYGGDLHGPHDFESFGHYLSLYCVAFRFGAEDLQDLTMDLCRAYYRHNSMTAPAYRIEYIYLYTNAPNHMRNFLTTTAAYRCLCEAPANPDEVLSDSLKGVMVNREFSIDFAIALIKLSKDGLVDVRKGSDAVFHVRISEAPEPLEPWQSP